MKKNKKVLYVYYFLVLLSILIFIVLFIRPLRHIAEHAYYNPESEASEKEFGSEVEEIINISDKSIVKLRFFLVSDKYDNLSISLHDEKNNEIFNVFVDEYAVSEMVFECPPLKNGKYLLKIVDNDGDNIKLKVASANEKAHLKGDLKQTLQLITYGLENYYFCLWYPLFMFVFLVSIYPFVGGNNNEKK